MDNRSALTHDTAPQLVVLDHGSGGQASRELIEGMICDVLGDALDSSYDDAARLPAPTGEIAFTTDSFVVSPPFFLNGNIGKIAICGTVNDLAVSGAIPKYISLSLILEEGYKLSDLTAILEAMRISANEAGVKIVCGDTKVMEKGAIDGIAINTSGIGLFQPEYPTLSISHITPGDRILLSTFAGDHGLHILSMREGLGFEQRVPSDCAPLGGLVLALMSEISTGLHAARDVTRGGIATILHELSEACGWDFCVSRNAIPIRPETVMGADMLGVDPLHLANEGCLVCFVSESDAEHALNTMRSIPASANAAIIGSVLDHSSDGMSTVQGEQEIVPLAGKILPRLC